MSPGNSFPCDLQPQRKKPVKEYWSRSWIETLTVGVEIISSLRIDLRGKSALLFLLIFQYNNSCSGGKDFDHISTILWKPEQPSYSSSLKSATTWNLKKRKIVKLWTKVKISELICKSLNYQRPKYKTVNLGLVGNPPLLQHHAKTSCMKQLDTGNFIFIKVESISHTECTQ